MRTIILILISAHLIAMPVSSGAGTVARRTAYPDCVGSNPARPNYGGIQRISGQQLEEAHYRALAQMETWEFVVLFTFCLIGAIALGGYSEE